MAPLCVTLSTLQLILQSFRCYIYVTVHSPTLPSLYLRHSSFSNPSVASTTSQLILQPFFRFSYVTDSSLTSPGEPPMWFWSLLKAKLHGDKYFIYFLAFLLYFNENWKKKNSTRKSTENQNKALYYILHHNVYLGPSNYASSGVLWVVPVKDPIQLIPLLLAIVGLIAWFEWLKMYEQNEVRCFLILVEIVCCNY